MTDLYSARFALTEKISAMQAQTAEGLLAQYKHFAQVIGSDIRGGYCAEWSCIIDSIQAGLEELIKR